jgi:hypothetical protein
MSCSSATRSVAVPYRFTWVQAEGAETARKQDGTGGMTEHPEQRIQVRLCPLDCNRAHWQHEQPNDSYERSAQNPE